MKPGYGGKLLLSPNCWTVGTDQHGHEWVTDRYLMARRECFRKLGRSEWDKHSPSLSRGTVRKVLTNARVGVIKSPAVDTGIRAVHSYRPDEAMLLASGNRYTWLNVKLWQPWQAVGLTPHLNRGGQILWFGAVRGNRTLMAVMQGVVIRHPDAVSLATA